MLRTSDPRREAAPPDAREPKVLAWFSCGDASAVAARLAIDAFGDLVDVVYCDTSADEHPDNLRFLADCEQWFGREILRLRSAAYDGIYDVFERTGWLVGPGGARCTTELKKLVRMEYQRPDDVHVFGFTIDEPHRVAQMRAENPEIDAWFPLVEAGLSKADCHRRVREAGIELPVMYRLGYSNNNCVGCVKGQAGYWNKIRRDFPDVFARMAAQERRMNVAICKTEPRGPNGKRQRIRVFLDELDPAAGRYSHEPDIECGVLCSAPPADS